MTQKKVKKSKGKFLSVTAKKFQGKRARRAFVNLAYHRNDQITASDDTYKKSAAQMRKFLKSFTFTGVASGEADRIEAVMENSDERWMMGWMPRKKDKVTARIVTKWWGGIQGRKEFLCGTFLVDHVSLSAPELVCTVGATSIPEFSSFRATEREKSWKKVKLGEIARKIAGRYHMKIVFDGPDFSVGTVEQSGQTDCDFLTDLCETYAYGIKIFKGKIIIYSKEKYEQKPVRGTITRKMMEDFSFESNLCGTYTGAKMKYTPEEGKETTVKVGKGNRWLTVGGDADSVSQAKRKALAAVNTENEKTATMTVTIMGNTKYCETDTVKIKGLYRLNGKYFIDKVEHTLDGQSGFKTVLEMHRVRRRIVS